MNDIESPAGPEMDFAVGLILRMHCSIINGVCRKSEGEDKFYFDTSEIWRPSTSIEHAWVVVERLRGLEPVLSWVDEIQLWLFNFDKRPMCELASAETAPLAICRAAIKAVG